LSDSLPSDRTGEDTGTTVRTDDPGRFVLNCPKRMAWKSRVDLVATVRRQTAGEKICALIVDLTGVEYMSSAGLGALFALRKHLKDQDGEMVLCSPNPTISRLLETVNLPKLIPVVTDIAAARVFLDQQ
jgi:anti-anti-sigma factor